MYHFQFEHEKDTHGRWFVNMFFVQSPPNHEAPASFQPPMVTQLISNEEVGIRYMMPLGPMLGFIYVDQGEGFMGEFISTEKLPATQGAD
jgi:hypothetical protein